jgi:hypothetical protein
VTFFFPLFLFFALSKIDYVLQFLFLLILVLILLINIYFAFNGFLSLICFSISILGVLFHLVFFLSNLIFILLIVFLLVFYYFLDFLFNFIPHHFISFKFFIQFWSTFFLLLFSYPFSWFILFFNFVPQYIISFNFFYQILVHILLIAFFYSFLNSFFFNLIPNYFLSFDFYTRYDPYCFDYYLKKSENLTSWFFRVWLSTG